MILSLILIIMAIILIAVTIIVVSVFGAGAIIIFGDVIVCIAIIIWIIKKIIEKKKR